MNHIGYGPMSQFNRLVRSIRRFVVYPVGILLSLHLMKVLSGGLVLFSVYFLGYNPYG